MILRNAGPSLPATAVVPSAVISGSNAAASITVTAVPGYRHVLHKLMFSYSATPTGGVVTVTGGLVTWTFYVTAGGVGALSINYAALENTDLVISISPGGAVTGSLNTEHTSEAI